MAQTAFVLPSGKVVFPSFADGDRRVKTPPARRMSDRDITARINWLERHGHHEDAEELRSKAFARMN